MQGAGSLPAPPRPKVPNGSGLSGMVPIMPDVPSHKPWPRTTVGAKTPDILTGALSGQATAAGVSLPMTPPSGHTCYPVGRRTGGRTTNTSSELSDLYSRMRQVAAGPSTSEYLTDNRKRRAKRVPRYHFLFCPRENPSGERPGYLNRLGRHIEPSI